MAVYDLYSKRKKRETGELPDVYLYDNFPKPFRVQVVHIWRDLFRPPFEEYFKTIHDILCREYGTLKLCNLPYDENEKGSLVEFFLATTKSYEVIDTIELSFRCISSPDAELYLYSKDAIEELNERFREHAIGYEFQSNQLIRIDSKLVHAEVVKPALLLLNQKHLNGANDEFLNAHEHYRHGKYKEAINECLKAFESTMKGILHKRNIPFAPNDTAKILIELCLAKGIIPSYLQSQFSSLRSTLQDGIPTIRNKNSGHGQGSQPHEVPEYMAKYAIYLTAVIMVFLNDCDHQLDKV